MREGAEPSAVVELQIPDDRGQQNDGRVGEEVALFLRPALIEVQQNDVGAFVSVRYVGHKPRIEGVAAVRTPGVVEIDDAELRPHGIPVLMPQQVVVGDRGEVVELVIVDVKRIPLFDALTDVTVDDGIALSRAGRSEDHRRAEGIDDIDPSLPPCAVIIVAGGEVDGIFVRKITFLLPEALVVVVEGIIPKTQRHSAPHPYSCGQQRQIPGEERRGVASHTDVGIGRQFPQKVISEEQQCPDCRGGDYMPCPDLIIADAAGTEASQHKQYEAAKLRGNGIGEEVRRPLKRQQYPVEYRMSHAVCGEPSVAEPIAVEQ